MGLDQFAFRTKAKLTKSVDFQDEIQDVEVEELHYWRKHPNLHGLMEGLYREKGGTGEYFNGDPVQLTEEDINYIASVIIDDELPHTDGPFFGQSMGNKDEENDDLQFCKEAIQSIKEGYTVYYDSWW